MFQEIIKFERIRRYLSCALSPSRKHFNLYQWVHLIDMKGEIKQIFNQPFKVYIMI